MASDPKCSVCGVQIADHAGEDSVTCPSCGSQRPNLRLAPAGIAMLPRTEITAEPPAEKQATVGPPDVPRFRERNHSLDIADHLSSGTEKFAILVFGVLACVGIVLLSLSAGEYSTRHLTFSQCWTDEVTEDRRTRDIIASLRWYAIPLLCISLPCFLIAEWNFLRRKQWHRGEIWRAMWIAAAVIVLLAMAAYFRLFKVSCG